MARNFFNRYVWLIDTIQRYKYIQFDDLQREWNRSVLNENGQELAQRTFFNHKDAIADMFGIDIKYDKARGYYIAEEELNFEGFRNWLLSSLSINNLLLECSDMRDRILFDEVPGGQQYVKTVVDAMRASTELEVTYQRFLDDEPRTFNLQPYCIKCFKQRWYVFGKNTYDKKLKCYANQGAIILGHVSSSVISNEVLIEEDAIVDRCVVMEGSVIKRGAKVSNTIVAPYTVIEAGVEVNLNSKEIALVGGKVNK